MAKNLNRKVTLAYPFVIWGLGIFFYFYIYIIEVSPSVMTSQFMGHFHINAKQMGNLAACFFYAYFIMQIPIGLMLDKFGVKKVLTTSIFMTALGTLIVASSNSFFIAETGRFITGLGAASAAIGCLKITAIWFPDRLFAILAGFMLSVAMIGSVIGQAPLSILIYYVGWRYTLYICSILGFIVAASFFVAARDRKKLHVQNNIQRAPLSFIKSLKDVAKKKQTWFLSIYSGFAFTPVMVFGGLWGVSFLKATHNFTETYAASLTSLVFIGFAVGAPFWGFLSEKTKRRLPYLYFATIMPAILILLLICVPSINNYLITVVLVLFGFFSSAFLLCFTMIKELNQLMFVGTAVAFMNTFNAALGSVSDPIIGHLLDLGWDGKMQDGVMIFSATDFRIAMTVIPLTLIVSACMLPFIRETHCKQME